MNTVTVRGRRTPKRPPTSDHRAVARRDHDAQKIFVPDDLCRRWEQIVSKGHS